jgi:hypothetical protein
LKIEVPNQICCNRLMQCGPFRHILGMWAVSYIMSKNEHWTHLRARRNGILPIGELGSHGTMVPPSTTMRIPATTSKVGGEKQVVLLGVLLKSHPMG